MLLYIFFIKKGVESNCYFVLIVYSIVKLVKYSNS